MQGIGFAMLTNVLAARLPFILILLVGFIIALVRWKKHPGVSLLVTLMFAIEVIIVLPFSLAAVLIPTFVSGYYLVRSLGMITGAVSLIATLASAIVWILGLVAIFGWRPAAANKNPSPQDGSS
jgi:hypothetical protein